MRRGAATGTLCAAIAVSAICSAKSHGVRTPGGRDIYREDETFRELRDQDRRSFVVEVVSGLAPEGNLGMLLGLINQPLHGLEYYAGLGLDISPAFSVPLSVRYMANLDGYRPYASAGYAYRRLEKVGVESHNVFFEIGYKWVIHHTHHLTAGVGLRRPLSVDVLDESVLAAPDVDSELLDEQIEASKQWVPTLAIRFSRAF